MKKVWQDPGYFYAFGFGTGLCPVAPGTWGTLAGIPIYLLLCQFSAPVYLIFLFILFYIGIRVSSRISKDLGEHDYSGIVCDEMVGFCLTMFLVPPSLLAIILGFLLFRLFDILKPPPIGFLDKHVKGGLGIMLDDVVAAIPAWFILQLSMRGIS